MTATWKDVERRTAKKLGGRRVGCTGKDTPDVVSEHIVAEVKHRRHLPEWIKKALMDARKHAGKEKLGIAVLHEHGRHDSLVVISLADFKELLGQLGGGEV